MSNYNLNCRNCGNCCGGCRHTSSYPRLLFAPQSRYFPCVGQIGPQGVTGATGAQGLIGPTGPQGGMGATGAQGATGATGAQGLIGPTGLQGRTGATGAQGAAGAIGPQGLRGPSGLRGDMGPTGPAGAGGSRGLMGPTGPRGDQGLAGETGPQGERGPMAATIPFSISNSSYGSGLPISTDAQGLPSRIGFAGFGVSAYSYLSPLEPGDWENGIITIRDSSSYPESFVMPYDGTLQNIELVFAVRSPLYLNASQIMRPFTCIAISDASSLTFTVLRETMTYTEPYVGEGDIPKYSLRKGSLKGLGIDLAEGTLVAILIGWMGEGDPPTLEADVSVSGGIYLD